MEASQFNTEYGMSITETKQDRAVRVDKREVEDLGVVLHSFGMIPPLKWL